MVCKGSGRLWACTNSGCSTSSYEHAVRPEALPTCQVASISILNDLYCLQKLLKLNDAKTQALEGWAKLIRSELDVVRMKPSPSWYDHASSPLLISGFLLDRGVQILAATVGARCGPGKRLSCRVGVSVLAAAASGEPPRGSSGSSEATERLPWVL